MIVADTGPLNYLIQLRLVDRLPRIFGRILVPYEVARELSHANAPLAVRAWIQQPPAWVDATSPIAELAEVQGLHSGELAALYHAERTASLLLVDDLRARKEARLRGLEVVGTLGVIYEAAVLDQFDFEEIVQRLTTLGFRVSDDVRDSLLSRWIRSKTR